MRVGLGYDIHPVRSGRPLVLGGVMIAHTQGLEGHSDADALVHAVCDALLGAMGEGDLGAQYPSSDSRFKDMNSLSMLKAVGATDDAFLVERLGYRVWVVPGSLENIKITKPEDRLMGEAILAAKANRMSI